MDVNTLHREKADTLKLNEIGRVEIETSSPIFFDPYKINHSTGSFILIDPHSNNTVAAGMIRGVTRRVEDIAGKKETEGVIQRKSPHTVWTGWNISRRTREERNKHKAAVLWLTGYSGSGKSTIARSLENTLFDSHCNTMLLDGDNIRHGLNRDLGFSDKDRTENIRRVGETARLFLRPGI